MLMHLALKFGTREFNGLGCAAEEKKALNRTSPKSYCNRDIGGSLEFDAVAEPARRPSGYQSSCAKAPIRRFQVLTLNSNG